MLKTPILSIIIPVYNGGEQLLRCLYAIRQSTFTDWELIVVDDGSSDNSIAVARSVGGQVYATGGRLGPAAARNMGAKLARGRYLFFTDSDCEVHPDTLSQVARCFQQNPSLEALFGSYDDAPVAPNFIAQYKNLFHHYVHQQGSENASTFWAGCGAIKRTRFLALGGFDVQRYRRPAIEDIDLGYRLKKASGYIRLAKHIQVKHLKAWTFYTLLKTDIFDRGIPWTRLILRDRVFNSDLNLQTHNRISVVALYGLLLALAVSLLQPYALFVAMGLAILLLWLNINLYHFFYQKRGLFFVVRAIPMHWLYYMYNAVAFGLGLVLYWREKFKAEVVPPPEPLTDRHEI
jgi:glycosyltransferase involved in cell wall biosynthesis